MGGALTLNPKTTNWGVSESVTGVTWDRVSVTGVTWDHGSVTGVTWDHGSVWPQSRTLRFPCVMALSIPTTASHCFIQCAKLVCLMQAGRRAPLIWVFRFRFYEPLFNSPSSPHACTGPCTCTSLTLPRLTVAPMHDLPEPTAYPACLWPSCMGPCTCLCRLPVHQCRQLHQCHRNECGLC